MKKRSFRIRQFGLELIISRKIRLQSEVIECFADWVDTAQFDPPLHG